MLIDPRITQLADLLVSHSTKIKSGERVLVELFDTPDEIGVALIRSIRARGGEPFINLKHSKISRELLLEGSEPQWKATAEHMLAQMKGMDAYIAIRGGMNISENSDVSPTKMQLASSFLNEVTDYRVNKTKWCVLRWPNASMAQMASMSTEAFEDFFFDVCLYDYPALEKNMAVLKDYMERANEVRIKGEGTDLTFNIKDIPNIICAGEYNIPDGEVFTAPIKDSVNGHITYNAPTIYQGIAFDQIFLRFENGKIIEASSSGKDAALNAILDTDEGARYIGEFAIGVHPKILNPMRDILFDEKIGGSFHFTPGQAYEEADNGNRSKIHWDMVCIQRPEYGGGEIWFDGQLIRKDGQFIPEDLHPLNF